MDWAIYRAPDADFGVFGSSGPIPEDMPKSGALAPSSGPLASKTLDPTLRRWIAEPDNACRGL